MPRQVHNHLGTPKQVASRGPGRYADGAGLYLHVASSGARWWVWRGTVHGQRIERGMGSCLDVTLAEARETAREWRRIAKAGGDPREFRDAAKRKSLTFEEAARQVHAAQVAPHARNAKHKAQWINTLRDYAFPVIGRRPVHTIRQSDILRVLAPIWTEKPETARRVRQRLRGAFDWARTAGHYPDQNPVIGVEAGLPKQRDRVRHFRALPYPQIPSLMRQLEEVEGMGALALRFLILTASRSGEVRGATWAEIDTEARAWVVPAGRMKAGNEHRVPLSDGALAVLEAARGLSSELVFPSVRSGSGLSDMTITAVLRRMDVPATAHGMRSSFRDWCEEMTGYQREVKEAALAHSVRDKVEAAYRRTDLFDKRRKLMEQWGRFCLSARTASTVVELRG